MQQVAFSKKHLTDCVQKQQVCAAASDKDQ